MLRYAEVRVSVRPAFPGSSRCSMPPVQPDFDSALPPRLTASPPGSRRHLVAVLALIVAAFPAAASAKSQHAKAHTAKAPAASVFMIHGGGFGHGIGMSQYGA